MNHIPFVFPTPDSKSTFFDLAWTGSRIELGKSRFSRFASGPYFVAFSISLKSFNYLSSKLLKSKVFERNSAWNIWSIIILNFLLFETVFSHNGEFFSIPCSSSPIIFWYSSFWCFQSRFLAWHVLKIVVNIQNPKNRLRPRNKRCWLVHDCKWYIYQ